MKILINWLISTIAVIIAAYLLPGVHIASFTTALVVALVLGIINAIIKPILLVLTLPITILTLGIFALILNGLLVLLAAQIVPGFGVDGLLWAIIFSIVLSIVNWFLHTLSQ